jgi:hypothetical protein
MPAWARPRSRPDSRMPETGTYGWRRGRRAGRYARILRHCLPKGAATATASLPLRPLGPYSTVWRGGRRLAGPGLQGFLTKSKTFLKDCDCGGRHHAPCPAGQLTTGSGSTSPGTGCGRVWKELGRTCASGPGHGLGVARAGSHGPVCDCHTAEGGRPTSGWSGISLC